MKTTKLMMILAALCVLASGCATTPAQNAVAAQNNRDFADDWRRYDERCKRETYLVHHGWHQQLTGYDFQPDEYGRLQAYPHYELQPD